MRVGEGNEFGAVSSKVKLSVARWLDDWISGFDPGDDRWTLVGEPNDVASIVHQASHRCGEVEPAGFVDVGENSRMEHDLDRIPRGFTGPGFVNLQLYDGGTIGLVRLRSLNLDEAVVLDAAATMRRAGSGQPGWIVSSVPVGLVPIIEGDANNAQVRGITWSNGPGRPEADLRITTVPDDLQIEWIAESDAESAVIDGHPGVLTVDGSTVTVRWSPEPGVLIIAARNGSVEETLAFARSVTAADQAAWDAFAVEAFGDYLIQCTGLFC